MVFVPRRQAEAQPPAPLKPKGADVGFRPNSGKPKIGHPLRRKVYSEELIQTICEALGEGEPLTVICRRLGSPVPETLYRWMAEDENLRSRIASARATGYDAIAHRSRKTARGLWPDEGGESTGDIQRDKLIIDTDHKLLKVWDPGRYGDRSAIELSGNVTLDSLVAGSLVEITDQSGEEPEETPCFE